MDCDADHHLPGPDNSKRSQHSWQLLFLSEAPVTSRASQGFLSIPGPPRPAGEAQRSPRHGPCPSPPGGAASQVLTHGKPTAPKARGSSPATPPHPPHRRTPAADPRGGRAPAAARPGRAHCSGEGGGGGRRGAASSQRAAGRGSGARASLGPTPPHPTPPPPPPRRLTLGQRHGGVLGVDGVEDALIADLRLGDQADLAADVGGPRTHGGGRDGAGPGPS